MNRISDISITEDKEETHIQISFDNMADTATRKLPNQPKKRAPSVANTAQSLQKKPSEAEPPKSVVDDAKSQALESTTGDVEESNTGGEFEHVTNPDEEEEEEDGEEEEEEDDDGTEQAIPAGSVDHQSNVVDDEGKVIGHVTGDKASDLEGSIVDQEGDVLDEEGNIIGKADLLEEAKSQVEDASSKLDEPLKKVDPEPETDDLKHGADDIEKPELAAPFGVQDNGDLTNATGDVVGKLSKGTPQELVGTSIKEIDPEGNLLNETGSTIGKAEIQPELLEGSNLDDKVDGASAVGSQVPESEKLKDGELPEHEKIAAASQIPDDSQVGEKLEGASTAGSQLPEHEKLEAGSQVPEGEVEEPKLDADGKEIPESKLDEEEPKLDADDNELPKEPELDSEGKPIENLEEPKLDEEGKPVEGLEEPKLDADGKELPKEPELDEEGKPIEAKEPELDSEGKPVEDLKEPELDSEGKPLESEEPKLDADGKPIEGLEEPKLDSEGKPIEPEEPKLDADGKPIEGLEEPKLDADGKELREEPELDKEGKPIEGQEEPELDSEGKPIEGLEEPKVDVDGKAIEEPKEPELDSEGNPTEKVEEPKLDSEGKPIEGQEEPKLDGEGKQIDEGVAGLSEPEAEAPDLSILKGKKVNKAGKIVDENGNPFGQLVEGEAKKLIGKKCDAEGKIWNDSGKVIGRAELLPEEEREAEPSAPFEDFPDSVLDKSGNVIFEGKVVGKLIEGDAKKLEGKKVDADGDVVDKNGNVLGKAERYQEEDAPAPEEPEADDVSLLEGKKVNKAGNVVDDSGKLFGRIVSGDLSRLIGKKCDAEGKIWGESGKVIGTAILIPAEERDEPSLGEFDDFPNAVCDRHGNILYEGQIIGKLIEGDARKLVGKKIDKDGEIVDRLGNVLGRAERWIEEDEPEPEPEVVDRSALAGKRVNKAGNVVDSHGDIYGVLVEGDPKKLAGRMCDKNGHVFDEGGNVVGRAELVPESERAGQKEGPFAGFASPTVTKDGKVVDAKGTIIGQLTEGDAKKLYGKEVDPDGDVLDKNGNAVGKAERWEEPEEEVKEVVHSSLFGRKVNKEGNVVDENGDTIAKLTDGNIKQCAGKQVDDEGDVYNAKGQLVGHVTLLEDIEQEKTHGPLYGRKVNKEGNVVDENGDLIGKLTEGTPLKCAGKAIDDDGDVYDSKGQVIGHVSLIEDIPEEPVEDPEPEPEPEPETETEPEETETEEEKAERLQKEQDRKLAGQMAYALQGCLDTVDPILKMITDVCLPFPPSLHSYTTNIPQAIDAAERQPKEELDEQKLVDTVKPLIEQGHQILMEANGVIRGLDPDGSIAAAAKGRAGSKDASPEEYRLADVLKELTGRVTQTIDNAKKKIAGMPHAKKELNPLWGLLAEPLGQILAAVGLLLAGVLGLVGRLLSGLGLGGLLDNLLGGLGLKGILKGLGLGMVTESLTGRK
jgi:hypothetical protein